MSILKAKSSKVLGLVAASVLIVILLMVFVYPPIANWAKTNNSILPGQPTNSPISTTNPQPGQIPITLSLPYSFFNYTAAPQTVGNFTVILLHADQQTMIGTATWSATTGTYIVSGSLVSADNGKAYLLLAPTTAAGGYGLLSDLSASQNSIDTGNPSVFMWQGSPYSMFALNFGNIQAASGGAATPFSFQLMGYQQPDGQFTGLGLTSYLNATTTSTVTHNSVTTAYWNLTSVGSGVKITRMQLSFWNNSATPTLNTTTANWYDSGVIQLSSVTIDLGNNQAPIYCNNIQWNGPSTGTAEISPAGATKLSTNPNLQFYGQPVLFGLSDSSTTMTVTTNWNIPAGSAGATYYFNLKVYFITPTGTTGSFTTGSGNGGWGMSVS